MEPKLFRRSNPKCGFRLMSNMLLKHHRIPSMSQRIKCTNIPPEVTTRIIQASCAHLWYLHLYSSSYPHFTTFEFKSSSSSTWYFHLTFADFATTTVFIVVLTFTNENHYLESTVPYSEECILAHELLEQTCKKNRRHRRHNSSLNSGLDDAAQIWMATKYNHLLHPSASNFQCNTGPFFRCVPRILRSTCSIPRAKSGPSRIAFQCSIRTASGHHCYCCCSFPWTTTRRRTTKQMNEREDPSTSRIAHCHRQNKSIPGQPDTRRWTILILRFVNSAASWLLRQRLSCPKFWRYRPCSKLPKYFDTMTCRSRIQRGPPL